MEEERDLQCGETQEHPRKLSKSGPLSLPSRPLTPVTYNSINHVTVCLGSGSYLLLNITLLLHKLERFFNNLTTTSQHTPFSSTTTVDNPVYMQAHTFQDFRYNDAIEAGKDKIKHCTVLYSVYHTVSPNNALSLLMCYLYDKLVSSLLPFGHI